MTTDALTRMGPPPLFSYSPYTDFDAERRRAHRKHAPSSSGSMEQKRWDHPIWLAVLGEEFGEVARVLCENELGNEPNTLARLREELVQVGAMTAAWIAALDEAAPRA